MQFVDVGNTVDSSIVVVIVAVLDPVFENVVAAVAILFVLCKR